MRKGGKIPKIIIDISGTLYIWIIASIQRKELNVSQNIETDYFSRVWQKAVVTQFKLAITYTDIYLNVYKQYLVYENSHTWHCYKRIYNYSFAEKQFPSRHVRFRSKEEIQEIIELKNFAGEEGGGYYSNKTLV